MIKLENVCYGVSGNVILNKINLNASQNSITIIYYDSGNGATSLAKILCGLSRQTDGEAKINGVNINPKNSGISLLLSKPVFFKRKSALSNLLASAKVVGQKASAEIAKKALESFGVNPKQKVRKMSQSEKLLFSFARSEFFGKKIVIADDILRGLTKEEVEIILPLFNKYLSDKTVIIFDSTKNIDYKSASKYYLSFGSLYPFEKEPKLWQIYCMTKNPSEKHFGKLEVNGKKIVIMDNEKQFILNSEKLKVAKERGVEDVLFIMDGNKVNAVFDAMDFERIL